MELSPPDVPPLPCPPDNADEFLSEPTPEIVATFARHAGPALVLGAGGKLGLHFSLMLARAFRALGRTDTVTAVSRFRTLRDRETFERQGISTRVCDLENPGELAGLPDAATVFFLAGVKFGTSDAPDLLRRLNVELPGKVAHRFRQARIAALSSGCVYPFVTPASGGATEETPAAPISAYARSCLDRELAFAEVSRAHGTPVVLIRLNYAVEFRYGLLVDIAERVFRGQPIDVTTGYVNVIWQRDAVIDCLRAIDLAASPAAIINVTGPGILRIRDLAERFGRVFNRTPVFVGREEETAWLNNAARAHRLFGSPPTSVDRMVDWIAAWLSRDGKTWGKPTGYESRDGQF